MCQSHPALISLDFAGFRNIFPFIPYFVYVQTFSFYRDDKSIEIIKTSTKKKVKQNKKEREKERKKKTIRRKEKDGIKEITRKEATKPK